MKYLKLGLLVLIPLFAAYYGNDLRQINQESLFMSSYDAAEFQSYINEFRGKTPILVQYNLSNNSEITQILKDNHLSQFPRLNYFNLNGASDIHDRITNEWVSDTYMREIFFLNHNEREKNFKLIKYLENLNSNLIGSIFVNYHLDITSKIIQDFLFPLVFVIGGILIVLSTKSLVSLLVIFLPSVFSSFLSLMFIKLFFESMNLVTSIIPLISFILLLVTGLHFWFYYVEGFKFSEIWKLKRVPILLTMTTTSLGFGSLYISEIIAIKQFAMISFITLISSFIFFILWQNYFSIFHFNLTHKSFNFRARYFSGKVILGLALFSIVGLFFSFNKISKLTEAMYFYDKEHKVRDDYSRLNNSLYKPSLVDILINYDLDYDKLLKLEALESDIENHSGRDVFSIFDILKDANRVYTGEYKLPGNKFSFFALLSKIPDELKSSFLGDNKLKLSLIGSIEKDNDYFSEISSVQKLVAKKTESFKMSGFTYLMRRSQNSLLATLVYSFGLSLFIISFIAAFYYKSFRLFLVFNFMNLVPFGLIIISMNLLQISFNVATIMTFSIGLGIIVDSTFHIIHGFSLNYNNHELSTKIYPPIFIGSFLLIISFLSFLFYDFRPIREFGLLLSISIFLGLIFDLAVLPTLFNKFIKKIDI